LASSRPCGGTGEKFRDDAISGQLPIEFAGRSASRKRRNGAGVKFKAATPIRGPGQLGIIKAFGNRAKTHDERRQKKRMEAVNICQRKPGINENYARELMELHPLGVEGGYRRRMCKSSALFTGWTIRKTG